MSNIVSHEPFNTPILMIVFNRPEQTRQVFEMVRQAQPPRLYVGADGPRPGRGEEELVAEVRAIVENVDWDCELFTLYQEENRGCAFAPPAAISWFFEHEEAGIILEDDCLPSPSFFGYCQELLERYKDDQRVFQISGSNLQDGWQRDPDYSYYFSHLGLIWGWASWRRAWEHYDWGVKMFGEIREKGLLEDYYWNQPSTQYVIDFLERVYNEEEGIDTWDYQWAFAMYAFSGMSINPNRNLIRNIGMNGADATHMSETDERHVNRPYYDLELPLRHPPYMLRDRVSDNRYYKNYYLNTLTRRIRRKTRSLVRI